MDQLGQSEEKGRARRGRERGSLMRVEGQGEGREMCLAARCTYRSRPCSSAAMLLLYSFSSRSS